MGTPRWYGLVAALLQLSRIEGQGRATFPTDQRQLIDQSQRHAGPGPGLAQVAPAQGG